MAQVTLPSGITIEYERRGSGEPLLLVMGLAGQLIDWPVEFVDRLVEAGFEVVLYDNRDVGLSTKTDWEPPSVRKTVISMLMRRPVKGVGYTVDDMADDGADLMDADVFTKAVDQETFHRCKHSLRCDCLRHPCW